MRAFAREGERDGAAEPARGAGDERDAVLETFVRSTDLGEEGELLLLRRAFAVAEPASDIRR